MDQVRHAEARRNRSLGGRLVALPEGLGSPRAQVVKNKRRVGPQEGKWVTLHAGNVAYVSGLSGRSPSELKALLEQAKKKKKYVVQIPLETPIFTREER